MHVQGPGDMLGLVSAEYVQYGLFDVCSYKLRMCIGHMRRPFGVSSLKGVPGKRTDLKQRDVLWVVSSDRQGWRRNRYTSIHSYSKQPRKEVGIGVL